MNVKVYEYQAVLYCKDIRKLKNLSGMDKVMREEGSQICTECRKSTNQTITDWWNAPRGQVIGKDENLCHNCADLRGWSGLPAINKEREKQNMRN